MPSQFTSTAALLVGNLLPIIGVWLWDWDVHAIVTLYWTENLILGAIMLAKMFYLGRTRALSNILFFLEHYGGFCFVHGVFIGELFAPAHLSEQVMHSVADPIVRIFQEADSLWWWAFAALGVSHLVSFLVNWLGQKEYLNDTMGSLMSAPYRRIMILHVTVLLGGVAVTELGSPVYLVMVLVLVKTAVDLAMHRREHRASWRAAAGQADIQTDSKSGEI